MDIETEVAIIGGGAAGLAAARLLTKHGLSCVVVEAAQQLGGRIRTLRVPEWQLPIDLQASGCQLLLQARVRRIEWRAGSVRVSIDAAGEPDDLRVVARRCVVTPSIGVLRSPPSEGGIEFRPVPEAFASALPGLGMGYVTPLVLRFEQAPWPGPVAGHVPTFVHVADAPFATFWRQVSAGQEQLTAWAAGPLAFELSALDETSRVDAALRSLAQATQHSFLDCKDRLLGAHTHDFNRDPLVRGAYSYVRPGATDPARALREPCEDTLFFAGEALDLRYPATVAGALGSGEHAARKLLATCR